MKHTSHRTMVRFAVALAAAGGFAVAAAGSAQASSYMGWVNNEAQGNFTFESSSQTLTVRDTRADGYGIEVEVAGKHSQYAFCKAVGNGQSHTCHLSFPKDQTLDFTIYGNNFHGSMTDAASYDFPV
ncbi:hypothetical protein [Streptomyces griseochromogenes]|uniref:hypothetical protein n=1 Tax=Streptomyces griseochromogenes TaxID=68214 RepID=UPI0037ABD792